MNQTVADIARDEQIISENIEQSQTTEVTLSRLRNIRLDPQHPPRYHGGHVIGPESLAILWDVDIPVGATV